MEDTCTLPPQCLNLRVQSSILLGSSSENEILLPRRLVFRKTFTDSEGNNSFVQDGHVFTVEESLENNHVYVSVDKEIPNTGHDAKKEIDSQARLNRFDIRTSSAKERILIQQSIGGIDELGRRARARSEQQRLNRKGIKVIEGTSLLVEQEQREAKLRAVSAKANIATKRQRVKKRSGTQQSSSTKLARKLNQSLWIPDISGIPIPPKGNQSIYVQLHGLPFGSTLETVRRFFTGLVPQRVLVVLSNRVHIAQIDATSYGDLSSFGLRGMVYTNRDVRVLVKFGSISEAGLATDRSGETIASKHIYGQKPTKELVYGGSESFTIGVTNISKELALLLSKLSFDAISGVPLHVCLADVESRVHPKVREILWRSAERAHLSSLDGEKRNVDLLIETKEKIGTEVIQTNHLSFADYKRYSIYHNQLLRIRDNLAASIRSDKSNVEAFARHDAVSQVTANACAVIESELDRVDGLLYQDRMSRFI